MNRACFAVMAAGASQRVVQSVQSTRAGVVQAAEQAGHPTAVRAGGRVLSQLDCSRGISFGSLYLQRCWALRVATAGMGLKSSLMPR